MSEVVVIGAGLFGCVIAKQLRSRGMEVVVLDAGKQDGGSKPAACLMKPSWYSGLGKDVTGPALKLLNKQYGVETIPFRVGPLHTDVQYCNPQKILTSPDEIRSVGGLQLYSGGWRIGAGLFGNEDGHLRAKTVIVAAGIWTPQLAPVIGGLTGQAGVAFLWTKEQVTEPFIKVWAPYKQLVAFNRGDGLWAGDGSAIKMENWTAAHTLRCSVRCQHSLNVKTVHQTLFGIRPYSKEKPCYLREHLPGLWVATGGAKNGLLAAAWCAQQISRRICP